MENYLSGLNSSQRSAVEHVQGPVMVLAGAGSGKTRVLTYRIAHLIASGVDAYSILALTFTNKASKEMRERVEKLIGSDAKNLWMGTFHSVFARILRAEAQHLSFPNDFTIYDTEDSRSLVKTIVKELELNKDAYKPAAIHSRISSMKNSHISVADYYQNEDFKIEDRTANRPRFADIYQQYVARCFQAGAMDFDDILSKTAELLSKNELVLKKYQERFKFIMVDEYQDTNLVQYQIIKKLATQYQNICVVGDDAQSIYGFRGADIRNILNFERDYKGVRIFKLEQNYRSTKNIVNAASAIIRHNRQQLEKKIWSDNEEGDKIRVIRASTDGEEGRQIAHAIFEQKMDKNGHNRDFAILYRTNSQSRSFEESLRKLNLNYRIVGGVSFYQRKEIKDLLAYFRLILNPNDEEAFKRVVNYPTRGIGNTTLENLAGFANAHQMSLWHAVHHPELDLPAAAKNKLSAFCLLIKDLAKESATAVAYEKALEVAKSTGILKLLYEDRSVEGISRYENIQELLTAIQEFSEETSREDHSLGAFMQDVALLTDADSHDDTEDKVTLMTIHAAKGLEFDYVYIVGLEENLFPSQMSMSSRQDLEEERRLFYVALTRARKTACISYALQRFRWGQLTFTEPSRFIDEIDSVYLDYELNESRKPQLPEGITVRSGQTVLPRFRQATTAASTGTNEMDFEGDDPASIKAGMQVAHARFGLGKVLKIEGDRGNEKATILFNDFGSKLILMKFAKLKIKN